MYWLVVFLIGEFKVVERPTPPLYLVLLTVFLYPAGLRSQDVFQGLGDLPGLTIESMASSVSSDGSVVVGNSDSSIGLQAFRWTASDGMVGLGELPGGNSVSDAKGVSADGLTVVGISQSANGHEAFRWTSGTGMVGLGDLPGGSFSSNAAATSADGTVVVGSGIGAAGIEAFRWTSAGMVGLGQHSGGSASRATGVSPDGSVIVGWGNNSSNAPEAFRWTSANGIVGLSDLTGGNSNSSAFGISSDGATIVGQSENFSGLTEAFRWTSADGMVGLGDLTGGIFQSRANAVSRDGSVIVGSSGAHAGQRAFIWDSTQGMRNLKEVLVDDFGLALAGWTLRDAMAISDDGLTIVGNGTNPEGNSEAWRASVEAKWMNESSGQWSDRSNWAFGIDPNELHDLRITPENGLTVLGPVKSTRLRSLTIGAQNGTATLNTNLSGTIDVLGNTSIQSGGRLAGTGTFSSTSIANSGRIELANLQVIGTLVNGGVVSGAGELAGAVLNANGGEIRVDSGQTMRITGNSNMNNAGLVRSIGGEIIFNPLVRNAQDTGLISGRDARFQFNRGLENFGSMGFSFGTSDVFGDVNNNSTGKLHIVGGAAVTFYDDLKQNGEMIVASVGDQTSAAVVFGNFGGSGGFTGGGDVFAFGDLRPGNSPASVLMDGNLFLGSSTRSLFEIGGSGSGEFDQILVTGDLALAGVLDIQAINGFQLSHNDHFLIAQVDGVLSGTFEGFHEGDRVAHFNGLDLFITYMSGDGNDVALFSAIPEPASLVVLLSLCVVTALRRRRELPRTVI